MNGKPTLPPLNSAMHFIAAALAGIITIGVFACVTALIQRDGRPMERLAAAERACVGHAYVSEREACMREWAAATQAARVASR